ncbi:hypothetical protein NDU88_001254 [Pleurodeles waltl]|uniref:HAT C-terminal dimerisation domain-containing protein n=1 Tax=Pleurodeles waltl TaxID=8319 RepID=A0AAV7R8I7_PLEWA|nr:hypothetical protein NDU88_001254 [Pleurodeles waltl]
MSGYESGEGAAEATFTSDFEGLLDATSTSQVYSVPEPPKKKAKKRFVKYRPEWELRHPNIRKSSDDVYKVKCNICNKDFSIAYGGERDIKTHEAGSQHKKNASGRAKMATISAYLQPSFQPEVAKVTAAEVTQVYHAVKHHISYRSLDCGFKLSKVIYPDSSIAAKASCGRTKASSITKTVLAPLSLQQAYEDLQDGYFSVCSDASNKGNIKLYPLLLQHFNFTSGVTYTLLDFYDDDAETATAIAQQITNKLKEPGLKLEHAAAYCGDNASVNYGRHHSVFQLLKRANEDILPANCPAHILHNCAKQAINGLSMDVESFVLKVYNHFSSTAKRTAELREFFSFVDLEWQPLFRHVPTRWLTLFPAIDRLLKCWAALKSYFLSLGQEKTPTAIWDFLGLESGEAAMSRGEAYLFFVHDILIIFNVSILQLEKDELSAPEVPGIFRILRNNLKDRLENRFFGFQVHNYVMSHDSELSATMQRDFLTFLERSLNYLEKWFDFSESHYLSAIEPCCLREVLTFQQLCKAADAINLSRHLDVQYLFNEYSLTAPALRAVVGSNLPCAQKWLSAFSKLPCDVPNIKKLMSFILSLPGSNAPTERIFSQLKFTWTDTRNRCDVELVKAELQVQVNMKHSCADFYQFSLRNKELQTSASSDKKYSFKNKH